MSDFTDRLQKENMRLQKLATIDELTGIFNRRGTEAAVREAMPGGGAMLMCDLDYFKSINDHYGHLVGDHCLQKTAELLSFIMRGRDVVGRVGGDEFVIFACGPQTEETVRQITAKIQNRFASYDAKAEVPLYLSIGTAIYREGESYTELFDRADRALLLEKKSRIADRAAEAGGDDWKRDMSQIRTELSETIHGKGGAFCQDFESFKNIFRYLERVMRRSDRKACVVLFSIAGDAGRSISPSEKFMLMSTLGDTLHKDLRLGDVYTRYSSGQYLVLLTDVDEELAEKVCLRVRKHFLKAADAEDEPSLLMHYCYQLEEVKTIPEPDANA